jgi:Protein of unknown function (DUF1460)
MDTSGPALSRRALLQYAGMFASALIIPAPLLRLGATDPNRDRLNNWYRALRAEGLLGQNGPFGRAAIRVGELAIGSPYVPFTLESYLRGGGNPRAEPLTLSLLRFDCVTLVEGCLAVARAAQRPEIPSWARFGREIERMRYRGGRRVGYGSRLHYFSEWISDGEKRGLVVNRSEDLGGTRDERPLRFMTQHRERYPALADSQVYLEIQAMEQRLDRQPRWVIPAKCIPSIVDRIETGDVLAFATEIQGLDASHAAFAHRGTDGVLRVLHAPLSGGFVEITRSTLPEYVAAIRHATGIMVARPLRALDGH